MSLLQVSGLSKSFGGLKAVDDVSFDARSRPASRAARPERRGQIDVLQHGQRTVAAFVEARSVSTGTNSSACVRATSGGSAWAAPSRSPRPSIR